MATASIPQTGVVRPKMDPFDLQVHLDGIDGKTFLAECERLGIKGICHDQCACLVANYFEMKLGIPVNVDLIETPGLFGNTFHVEVEATNFLLMPAYKGPKWMTELVKEFDAGNLPEFVA